MTLPLLDIVARYTSPSKATSKQWSSPCPFCGGNDRFIILPYESAHNGKEMPPHAFCRQCNAWVTAEMLLQRKEGLSWHDAHAIVEGSKQIDEVDPGQQRYAGKAKKLTPAEKEGAPWQEWQWAARGFARMCKAALWSEVGEKALQWLRERGLSDESIDKHELGFCPQDLMTDWGTGAKIKLYRGIVIPYLGEDQLWKIEFRRSTNIKDQRYRMVEGSSNTLYGYECLAFRGKAVMVEGVFDAIIMEQALREAGIEGVAVVATGSTDGSKVSRWKMKLSLCDRVVIAMDSDEGGENAAQYWLKRLSDSYRWTPSHGDVNDTWLKDKAGLVDACMAGFIPRKPCKVCADASIDEDRYGRPWCTEHFPRIAEAGFEDLADHCYECGDEVEMYDDYCRAWCAVHQPGEALPVAEEPVKGEEEALSIPANNISESEVPTEKAIIPTILPDIPTESTDIPIVAPAPHRRRREPPKPTGGCATDGCHGIGKEYDALGGRWCDNCKLRRELVDGLFALGFPRLEYSPTHYIEAGEETARDFAKSMSGIAISMGVREVARLSRELAAPA